MSSLALRTAENVVGGFTLEEVLGQGATAVVYRATHPGRVEPVALKLITADTQPGAAARERFERESRLAAAVVHQSILPVYEVGEHEGHSFVVMKLAPDDLAALLRREGRLDPERAVTLVTQIAAALDAAHAHGLVHRDVKPSNILLDHIEGEERAYLADFGVARAMFTDPDLPGELVGTIGYASPEQIRGEPIGHRTDIYALGCLLHKCLTGRVPYASRDTLQTLWSHLHDTPPKPTSLAPALPKTLDQVVQRALAKNPGERYETAGALAEATRTGLARRPPRRKTVAPQPANTNLTTPPSRFLGRAQELSTAEALLRTTRLLTVTGPGGAGKTRFAIELAAKARKQRIAAYDGGVYACFLAPLRDPALVLPTIAQMLSVTEQPGRSVHEALAARVGPHRVLLLLDNLEHLPQAATELAQLLTGCPSLTLLVTSRERLRLTGEVDYELPPLAPEESVALFCERADCQPSKPITELCARLDGLPLAIELAAARTPSLLPEQLLTGLARRLDLLQTGDRDTDPRQQTLRATIEWSYNLLTATAQTLFARLSVFTGGCTSEAAEAVCKAELDTLETLVDKNLLRRTGDRFWLLETMRELAAELLEDSGDTEALRRRHAEYFTAHAERIGPDAHGRTLPVLEEVARDHDNFRAVLQWADGSGELSLLASLCAALGMYWYSRGPYAEARGWLELALSREGSIGDARTAGRIARGLGAVCDREGDYELAKTASAHGLELARRAGDRSLECSCLAGLSAAERHLDDPVAADHLRECLEIARKIGDEITYSRGANILGVMCVEQDRFAEAESALRESFTIAERIGEVETAMLAGANLGLAEIRTGRTNSAAARFRKSLRLAEEMRHAYLQAQFVGYLAGVADRQGDQLRAARLFGVQSTILEVCGAVLDPYAVVLEVETRASIRDRLSEQAAAEAFAAGRELERAEAMAYALEEPDTNAEAAIDPPVIRIGD